MLPPNAPPEYADRAALWNSVEEIEKQWNSQLARRFVAALPREVPMELLPQMVKEYCEEHFVSKGMCCDFAIHDPDPPGHNPHCHFMLTMESGCLRAERFMTLTRTASVSSSPPADGKAIRKIPLTGTNSIMPRNGGMAGKLFRTNIWSLPEVQNGLICVLMSDRDLTLSQPFTWELLSLRWSEKALRPTSAI